MLFAVSKIPLYVTVTAKINMNKLIMI